ncbi:hypothetical protein [Clostridium gasigenes]|uniref:hypothetical protein n=1 Tax=Clostridium gasigenes TaxID=94869 RepID=UPI001C0D679B|nr:hypothetical protein [Clostridium gasigenes]MBU3109215.1 hypothetical protein [Clostridium gasigenes]
MEVKVLKSATERVITDSTLRYEGQIEYDGWQELKFNDEICGTAGQSKRLESILIIYPGVEFRVFVGGGRGWQDWRASGEIAGTLGIGYEIQKVEIKSNKLEFALHISNYGWTNYYSNTEISNGVNKVEAIRIREK